MYKRHKGFTLIELLAVIIILAIVALIATPIVLNVVEDARKSAGLSEANMIYSSINNYCASSEIKKQMGTLGENDVDCSSKTIFDLTDLSKMVNLGNTTVESNTFLDGKLTSLKVISNKHTYVLCSTGAMALEGECDANIPPEPEGESLIKLLLKQYSDSNITGLVKDTSNPDLYYYKGTNEEVANNFLWYGGHQWRVLEFDNENKTLTLITQQPLTLIQPASAVWIIEQSYNDSYINKWLTEYFWASLDGSIQSNIKDSAFYIGIYTDVDEITTTKRVGLLDQTQYERAGSTNSFLDIKDRWWLGNRSSSSHVRIVDSLGNLSNFSCKCQYEMS